MVSLNAQTDAIKSVEAKIGLLDRYTRRNPNNDQLKTKLDALKDLR